MRSVSSSVSIPEEAGACAASPMSRGVDAALLATPILIVEDEVMIAWMVESLLEEAGFTAIDIASTATQATASADRRMPGLIITDINLGSGPDGVTTAAEIARLGTPAVLFVTAYVDDATRARVEAEVPGAPVLRKPVQADKLYAAVIGALAGRRPH